MIKLHFALFYSLFLDIKGEGGARVTVNLMTMVMAVNSMAVFEILMHPIFSGQPLNALLHISVILSFAFTINHLSTKRIISKKAYEDIVVKYRTLKIFLSIAYVLFSCLFFPLIMYFMYS